MDEKIPKIIQEVGFDFDWSEKKVWALNIPITEICIKELEWHFNIPFWNEHGSYNLKPIDVINNPDKHKKKYERIMKSDLNYPLDIMENKGRWLLLDGLHRLVKSTILGNNKVKVRIIPREKIPEITQ